MFKTLFKWFILVFFFLLIFGCHKKSANIGEDKNVSINYPVTNIGVLDDKISSYINKVYLDFKKNSDSSSYLDVSYTYRDVNEDIVNISLTAAIKTNKTFYKIKSFTYNKKTNVFLTLEDIVKDVEALDYDVKKALVKYYRDLDMDYLNNFNLDNFKFNDDNLTIFINFSKLSGKNKVINFDIPLNSIQLLIDIDKSDDIYFSFKEKNISLDDKVVAITFDDGPSKYTNGVLDVLKKYNVCATFFVVGDRAYHNGEILRRIIKEGSEIGNHSYSHKKLNNLSEEEFKNEIRKTQIIIKDLTGTVPTLFRPTYGGYTKRLMDYTDLTFVLWDVDSKDWLVKSKEKILKNVLPNVKSGSIVLFHDNHVYSLNSLEDIIIDLKNRGYKFLTVSELLKFIELKENEWVIMI